MKEKFKNKEYWLSLSVVLAIFIMGISNVLRMNNTTYALEQINLYDSNIFAGNIAVYADGMSPRFFMDVLVTLGMRLFNGSWITSAVIIIYFGTVVLAIATVEMIFNLASNYRLFLSIILAIFLRYDVNNGFPGWGSFPMGTIGMGTAYAFVMLALSQIIGEEKRWNAAWIILAIATLLHVHEGMWGFCIFFILFVCQSVKERKVTLGKRHWAFIIFVLALGICIIPGLFSPESGITDEEFVQIYAYYRASHHFVPSSWGFGTIAKYFCLIFASAVLCWELLGIVGKIEERKYFLLEATMAIASWIAVVVLTYIFVEKIPSTLFVTMYVTKYLKYVGVLSVIWCIKSVRDCLNIKEYLLAGITTATVYLASNLTVKWILVVYLLAIVVIILWEKYDLNNVEELLVIGFLALVVVFHFCRYIDKTNVVICIVFMALPYCTILWNTKIVSKLMNNVVVVVLISLFVLGFSTKDKVWTIKDGTIQIVTADSYLERRADLDLYQFAQEFKDSTKTSEMFISDPEEFMNAYFQIAAQRNGYTNNTHVPTSITKIKEWYDRIVETRELFSKNASEIHKIMQDKNIDYILVNSDNYKVFEDTDCFKIRNISKDDNFRIYEAIN